MKNRNSLKKCVLDHRLSALVVTALAGMLCVYVATRHSDFLLILLDLELALSDTEKTSGAAERFLASFYVIVLGLPTLAMLWFFRTHDTREQIAKTEESTNINILFNAQKMLFENNSMGIKKTRENPEGYASIENAIGFAQLMHLRQQGFRQSSIDLATRHANLSGRDLTSLSLRGADLQFTTMQDVILLGADLTGANLCRAHWPGAYLHHANLQNAKLEHAELERANMQYANLQGANMRHARLKKVDLSDAKLQGADLRDAFILDTKFARAEYYQTLFPEEFDPDKAGMIPKKA